MAENLELIVRVKQFRQSGGLTQQDLADRVGVTRQTIISIERGKYKPSIELALRLAKVFETSVEALFELNESSGEAES